MAEGLLADDGPQAPVAELRRLVVGADVDIPPNNAAAIFSRSVGSLGCGGEAGAAGGAAGVGAAGFGVEAGAAAGVGAAGAGAGGVGAGGGSTFLPQT